jgi:hypothetical protein
MTDDVVTVRQHTDTRSRNGMPECLMTYDAIYSIN